MNAILVTTAIRLGMTNIRRCGDGANSHSHILGDMMVKGTMVTHSLKIADRIAGGSRNEVNMYEFGRLARMASIPFDGFNVSYARMEGAAAVIRWASGFRPLCNFGGADERSLALARSWGRALAVWCFTGTGDRHSQNVGTVEGCGGFWSIDHEEAGVAQTEMRHWTGSLYAISHLAEFAKGMGAVNVPMANGRAFVRKPYPMERFCERAAGEFRLTFDRLMARPELAEFAGKAGILNAFREVCAINTERVIRDAGAFKYKGK